MKTDKEHLRGVTLRAVLLGAVLTPAMTHTLIELEVVRYTHPTLVHPLSNVVFVLFCLIAVNRLVKEFVPHATFSMGELLTVYVMLGVVSTLCSHDLLEILVTLLAYPYRFSTPENEWRELILPYLPDWLTVSSSDAVNAYYRGQSSFFRVEHLRAWAMPLVWWLTFVFALFAALLSINTFLRRQWIEHERLSYPIIQLPLEMTRDGGGFFRNPVMWSGFGLAGIISVLNLLNSVYPQVPMIPVKRIRIDILLGLSNLGAIQTAFYPFAVGISFLIPLDLLFSCWAFYWIYKAEIGLGAAFGWNQLSGYPFSDQQAFGAYLSLLGFALWAGRGHLRRALQVALSGSWRTGADDASEPMPYRAAGWMFVLSCIYLFVFSLRAGMSVWVFPLFFGIYFALGTMIARMRAELGFLVHDLHNTDPQGALVSLFGTQRLGARNMTVFSLYQFFNRAYRAHPAPPQLEAFKIAERTGIHPRQFVYLLLGTTVFGGVVVTVMLNAQYYAHGADTGYFGPWALAFAREIYRQLEQWIAFPSEPDGLSVGFMGVGFLATTVMMAVRSRFLWWHLHPLGYAMAGSWGMYNLWCPLFVAWALKFVILRQGGLGAYRRAAPFFMGLALGDYVLGYAWSLGSIALNRTLYQFWP